MTLILLITATILALFFTGKYYSVVKTHYVYNHILLDATLIVNILLYVLYGYGTGLIVDILIKRFLGKFIIGLGIMSTVYRSS